MAAKRKPQFEIGTRVSVSFIVARVDRRFSPPVYKLQSSVEGWILDDWVRERELRKEHGDA